MNVHARFRTAMIVACLALMLCAHSAAQQGSMPAPASAPASAPLQAPIEPQAPVSSPAPVPLKVTSTLVTVRAVVRDAHGYQVEGLQKEDFKLFDQGKEQAITQFEEELPPEPPAAPAPGASAPLAPGQTAPPVRPGRFLAMYFDTLNSSDTDLIEARDAAEKFLTAHLQPQDRVAIFTPEQLLTDFTSDPKQIHDALFKLHPSARTIARPNDCPPLTDYEAQQIVDNPPPAPPPIPAWTAAVADYNNCRTDKMATGSSDPGFPIYAGAKIIVAQAEANAHINLAQIGQLVRHISQMPGQRIVILASAGFATDAMQTQLDQLIDEALRSQVVVSSLDPRGLVVGMDAITDASKPYSSSVAGGTAIVASLDVQRTTEFYDQRVLQEVAEGTGGVFFHNSNDLPTGFSMTAGPPAAYILGFAPSDDNLDGKFHPLKVTLAKGYKGYTVQTRAGYYAPANEAEAEAEAKEGADAVESQRQEEVQEIIRSSADGAQFPVELNVDVAKGHGGTHELSVTTHVDPSPLHFDKQGDHNLNTLTFFFDLFDQQGNLVQNQVRETKLDVRDAQLANFLAAGMDVNLTFSVKPGTYRVREVVTESEQHLLAALTRNVDASVLSAEKGKKSTAAAALPWSPPHVDARIATVSLTPPCSLPDVLKMAGARAQELIDHLRSFGAQEQVHIVQTGEGGAPQADEAGSFNYAVDYGGQTQTFAARELRTALPGTSQDFANALQGGGLPVYALIFSPELQTDYDMRCEGATEWNNRDAWLVYFHQDKNKPPRTAAIPTPTHVYPLSLKGRAWIAADSGQILHLEAGLAEGVEISVPQSQVATGPTAPGARGATISGPPARPQSRSGPIGQGSLGPDAVPSAHSLYLQENAVSVDYAPVEFQSQNVQIWLPQSAVSYADWGDHRVIIQHTFSSFQLFSVQTNQNTQTPPQP